MGCMSRQYSYTASPHGLAATQVGSHAWTSGDPDSASQQRARTNEVYTSFGSCPGAHIRDGISGQLSTKGSTGTVKRLVGGSKHGDTISWCRRFGGRCCSKQGGALFRRLHVLLRARHPAVVTGSRQVYTLHWPQQKLNSAEKYSAKKQRFFGPGCHVVHQSQCRYACTAAQCAESHYPIPAVHERPLKGRVVSHTKNKNLA